MNLSCWPSLATWAVFPPLLLAQIDLSEPINTNQSINQSINQLQLIYSREELVRFLAHWFIYILSVLWWNISLQCGGKNIRFVVMNNLLPSSVKLHAKYDLKGSTYKRRASTRERTKSSPTFKDLDFVEINPEGIYLEADNRDALKKTIERDCRVIH